MVNPRACVAHPPADRYGPPGTGKTMLAKVCVCVGCRCGCGVWSCWMTRGGGQGLRTWASGRAWAMRVVSKHQDRSRVPVFGRWCVYQRFPGGRTTTSAPAPNARSMRASGVYFSRLCTPFPPSGAGEAVGESGRAVYGALGFGARCVGHWRGGWGLSPGVCSAHVSHARMGHETTCRQPSPHLPLISHPHP